jgi:hypothetical protein
VIVVRCGDELVPKPDRDEKPRNGNRVCEVEHENVGAVGLQKHDDRRNEKRKESTDIVFEFFSPAGTILVAQDPPSFLMLKNNGPYYIEILIIFKEF